MMAFIRRRSTMPLKLASAPMGSCNGTVLAPSLNPAVILVAFWMGRSADQWQKLPVAAFAAALAGSILLYVVTRLDISSVNAVGRAAAGIFTAQFLFGLVWAYLGRRVARRVP
jgi:glycerol uptake facilitator-like aquaporin